MPEVLFVSKPVAPPWNDSNKNLVRDLARGMTRYRPHVMVPRGADDVDAAWLSAALAPIAGGARVVDVEQRRQAVRRRSAGRSSCAERVACSS